MENASKALIMAGAILIGILILSIGIAIWNSSQQLSEQYDEKRVSDEINQYNNKFLAYSKNLNAQEMVTVINMVKENNTKYSDVKDREITLIINNVKIDLNQPDSFKVKIMQEEDGTTPTYRIAGNGVIFYNNGYIKELKYTTDKYGFVSDTTLCNPHDYVGWQPKDNAYHYNTCSKCGNVLTETHNNTYTWVNSNTHNVKCATCGLTYDEPHEGGQIHTNNEANNGKCTKCGQKYFNHTWGGWEPYIAASCTEKGQERRRCSCGTYGYKEIPALGHDTTQATCTQLAECKRCHAKFGKLANHEGGTHENGGICKNCGQKYQEHNISENTTQPTCTENGKTVKICSCGVIVETTTINSYGGHTWVYIETIKPATCTNTGTAKRKCSRCNKIETVTTEALGHNYGSATCTSPAMCIRCYETTGQPIGHDWGDWEIIVAATCTTDGVARQKCSRCDATNEQTTGKSGHNYVSATCTTKSRCTNCGNEIGDILGHDWGDPNTTQPTCTTPGAKTRSCRRAGCGATDSVAINALGHDWEWEKVSETQHIQRCRRCTSTQNAGNHSGGTATCTSAKVCTTCGLSYGGASGHSWSWEKVSETQHRQRCTACGSVQNIGNHTGGTATCTSAKVCTTCGLSYGGASGHSWSWEKVSETQHRQKCSACGSTQNTGNHLGGVATCTAAKVCSTCGLSYGNALGHDTTGPWRYNASGHYKICKKCSNSILSGAHDLETVTVGGNIYNTVRRCKTCQYTTH